MRETRRARWEWVNPRWFNLVSWLTVVVMVGLTLAYAGITLRGVR